MSDIVIKYNQLNKIARQEVNDFLDFLISRQKTIKTKFSMFQYGPVTIVKYLPKIKNNSINGTSRNGN